MEIQTKKTQKRRRFGTPSEENEHNDIEESAAKQRKFDQRLSVNESSRHVALTPTLRSAALGLLSPIQGEPLLDTPEHDLEESRDDNDPNELNLNPNFNFSDIESPIDNHVHDSTNIFEDDLVERETPYRELMFDDRSPTPFPILTPTFDDGLNMYNRERETLTTYPRVDPFHEENQDDQLVCKGNEADVHGDSQRVDALDANAYSVRLRLASRQIVWSNKSAPLMARTTRQRSCEILMLKYVSRLPGDSRIRVWSNERGRIFYDCECGNRLGVQDLNKIKRHCAKLHQHHYKCPMCRSKFLDVASYNNHILSNH